MPDWSAPALRTESAADALYTWHRALAQQPLPAAAGAKIGDGGVHAGTAATFFEGVLGLPGDVLLLLYSASDAGAGGPHSGLSSAWAELAHALAGHDGGDRLSFAVLARDVNDLPIALSPALPDETVAEVLVFAKDAHDSPTALFGGNGPPAAKTGDTSVEGTALAFKMEVVRQLVMRARDKSYGQLASTLLGNARPQQWQHDVQILNAVLGMTELVLMVVVCDGTILRGPDAVDGLTRRAQQS